MPSFREYGNSMSDGRLHFATTEAFLQRFGLASLQELTEASLSNPDNTSGAHPSLI
jgi:chromosome segregation and condensation protein ScpB